ncbi:hypothetical protein [Nocardia asteroides]
MRTDLKTLAERICRSDPRGRRSVATVTEILIRHRVHGHNASRIAREFGPSRSAISRILRAADQLEPHLQDELATSADDSSASTDRPADRSNVSTTR